MTGIECLQEELLKRGFSKQKIANNSLIPEMLDIFANSQGLYKDLDKLQKDIKRLEKEKAAAEGDLQELRHAKTAIEWNYQNIANSYYKPVQESINRFLDALNSAETQEARDALRTAQMFIQSVDVRTAYDNTAFIIGLSAILSKGAIDPVDELRKINTKIPTVECKKINTVFMRQIFRNLCRIL
jgi:chromosome segregation ATPase